MAGRRKVVQRVLEGRDLLCERARAFVREFFHVYLEKRDFAHVERMLDSEVTWFGTGAHEICHSYEQAVQLLEAERDSWDGHFRIEEYWSKAVVVDETCCNVYGTMQIKEDSENPILLEMENRFSMLCKQRGDEIFLLHAHYSVPNAAQGDDEFVHGDLVQNYNMLLEEALCERTAQLQATTQELESMANNISGGLQMCVANEEFTIRYISDGFLKLMGYEREELLNAPHTSLVHPDDIELLKAQMARQLELSDDFSVVYRVVRKDGEVRWVLDNGTRLAKTDGAERMVQCFLTDITAQKQQEEELRVSQKRYEVALQQMNATMFEYNIATKQLMLYEEEASFYGMPTVIDNGPQVLATSGYCDPACVPGYLEMYRKICSGEESTASCMMTTHDVDGNLHEFELSLTAVLDEKGVPIRAIGVQKNTSHLRRLQREQEFGKSMTGGRAFICEADITADRILYLDTQWCKNLDVTNTGVYSTVISDMLRRCVAPEERDYLIERFSVAKLIEMFEQGKHLTQFTFSQLDRATGMIVWHEATINIIRDEVSGNVCVRTYHEDVTDRKHKELQADEEQRLYENMRTKAIVAYDVNVTRDLVLRGHEHWAQQHNIQPESCYTRMLQAFARQATDPQGGERLIETFNRNHMLQAYFAGERELSCQYRKQDGGQTIWAECTVHLFEDPVSGDIRGYAYVENIDKKKRAELALRYKAEHDAHTNLCNKETTAELIRKYLKGANSRQEISAFLMIDMDRFKDINDRFGHQFGDKVIAEVGSRIRALFREDDIVGRIGGDEFCVFMKQVENGEAVENRAKRLCSILMNDYSDGQHTCDISASIGIAFYPAQGRSFEELYHRADSALYDAKRKGRSCYTLAL